LSTTPEISEKIPGTDTLTQIATGIANTLSRLELEEGVTLDPITYNKILKVIVATLKKLKAKSTAKRSLYDPSLIYNLLAQTAAKNLEQRTCDGDRDDPQVVEDLVVLTRYGSGDSLNNGQFSMGSVTLTFGANTVDSTTCNNFTAVQIPYDPTSENAPASSITQGNSSVVSITGLTLLNNLLISYPISTAEDVNNAKNFRCAYRSDYTQAWTIDNTVTTSLVSGTLIQCSTSHLTEFAVQNSPATNSDANNSGNNSNSPAGNTLNNSQTIAAAVGAVFGALVVAAIVVVAIVVVRRRRMNRITMVHPMEMETVTELEEN
jgi:hypothetical protein